MGWDRWEEGEDRRARSRSSSRERRRRRRSRSRSSSSDRGYHHRRRHSHSRSRSRSRSPGRGWHHHDHRSVSPPPARHQMQQHPPWLPGAEALPPWQQQQQPEHPPWTQPGGLGGPVQPGGQAFVSRWDTGSRDTSSRGRSRGSDSDRDWESEERGHRGGREVPTSSVFLKGLPYDADESDVHAAFASFPNILSVKVLRDRATGHSKGTAFLDFASVDDARVLMESEARYSMAMGSNSLYLDYATGPPGGGAGAAGGPALDWICDMCSAVNVARRLECYHCSTARPANPKRVTADLNEPSNILKVSGLEPHTSEEALYQALSSAGQHIADMRVIKDKFTGAPRGFAFVELSTVAAAGAVMLACQGVRLPGQLTPLKICYAKAKESMMGSAAQQGDAGAAPAAAAAAAAVGGGAGYDVAAAAAGGAGRAPQARRAAGPLGWKPKEFNPDGSVKQDPQPQQQQQQQQPTHTAATAGHATHQQQQQASAPSATVAAAPAAAGPGPSSESAAAAAAAGVDAATIQALTQAGFEYQASSGYWWDPKSGYYYDAKTQLYYHHSTNQWYQYIADTGQYTAVGGGGQQQQQQQKQGPAAAAEDKRRRAVIGSAPQYNPEGLLAAAALAEERAAEERRVAAAKAARERQQQQQQQSKQGSRQQPRLMQGKPGLGCLPGTGSVPAPPLPPPTAAVVADGNLRGVVYRSKWSQQRAQAQQQQ